MAELIYAMITSLDGYVEDERGRFEWAEPDDELATAINDLERPIGIYLYGRRMYEMMMGWENEGTYTDTTGRILSEQPQSTRVFAQLWQSAEKIVYSRSLDKVRTERTQLQRDFDPNVVRRLKADAASDIAVGGPELAAAAIRSGVVDEVHLFVVPIVIGAGKRVLPAGFRCRLGLVDVRRFAGGSVHLRYRLVVAG